VGCVRLGGEVSEKPDTARSYRATVLDDNAIVSINLKWLGQIAVLIGMLVYGYWQVEIRIRSLESNFEEANLKIEELVNKHIQDEEERYAQMEEELKWYQKLTNKKKKK
jgi:hypothetical protein